MTLTTDQLTELTDAINARLAEFELGHMGRLSRGVVRIAYERITAWQMKPQRGIEAIDEFNTRIAPNPPAPPLQVIGIGDDPRAYTNGADAATVTGIQTLADSTTDAAKYDHIDNLADLTRAMLQDQEGGEPEPEMVLLPTRAIGPQVMAPSRGKVPHPDTARANVAMMLASASGGTLVEAICHPRTLEEADNMDDDFDDEDEDGDEPGDDYKTSEAERRRAREYRQRKRRDRRRPLTENGEARGLGNNILPTLAQMVAEVRRISMDKRIMPSIAQFDAARPANWATADAQCARLGLTWAQLAEQAELKVRVGGRPPRGQA